jgi:hypothetical protein
MWRLLLVYDEPKERSRYLSVAFLSVELDERSDHTVTEFQTESLYVTLSLFQGNSSLQKHFGDALQNVWSDMR